MCVMNHLNFQEKDFVNVLKQQNSALAYLQQQKILHCDIKPDNIIYDK